MALVWPEMNPDEYSPPHLNQHHSTHNLFHANFPTLSNHLFRSANMMNPEVDIRETPKEFWVDVSMPGVSDRESIVIQCLTARTITITSKVGRPHLPSGESTIVKGILHQNGEAKPHSQDQPEAVKGQPATHDTHQETTEQSQHTPRFLIAERSVGLFHRTLHFPHEIDEDRIRAKLDYGLLSIQVPKLSRTTHKQIRVDQ